MALEYNMHKIFLTLEISGYLQPLGLVVQRIV